MLSQPEVDAYRRDGVIVVPELLYSDMLDWMRAVVARLVAASASITKHDSLLLSGGSVTTPRLAPVPVRMPFPPAARQESIYETLSAAKTSYLGRAA